MGAPLLPVVVEVNGSRGQQSRGYSQETGNLAECLTNERRVQLLVALAEGPHTPSELSRGLSLRPSLIAHHLRILASLGLVAAQRSSQDRRAIHYQLRPEGFRPLMAQLTLLGAVREAAPSSSSNDDHPLLATLARSGDPLFVVDAQYRIAIWNPGAEALLGRRAQEVEGKSCHEVLIGRDPTGHPICARPCRPLLQLEAGSPPTAFPMEVHTENGHRCPVVTSLLPLPRGLVAHVIQRSERLGRLEWFAAQIEEAMAALDTRQDRELRLDPLPFLTPLTSREREVLTLLAQGASTEELAARLFVTRSTVRKHIQSLLHKLDARSRLEAVRIAVGHGWIT